MIPVLTPSEMAAVDGAAPEPVEVLISRAGAAVARVALETLGGAYGRRVVVVAGKGNNGADGRAAAARLRRRGVRVTVFEASSAPAVLPPCDLVIDAAYGTGFRGTYDFPDVGMALVLAVDVPSGPSVDADVTVTFAALKPSLLFAANAGTVVVEDIGLDVSSARMHVVEVADVLARLPRRAPRSHKYEASVLVVAGSPGMGGAASLCSAAAMRAGAGYCRLASPGSSVVAPVEVVSVPLPSEDWSSAALDACERMKAAAIGPGLGRSPSTLADVARFVADAPVPVVVDADALSSIAELYATCGIQLSNEAAKPR
ncbi:MAG: ADP-dependent NAD(P)H-hydrate dehydratase / NAD(P)H-hydrate epimerase [Actinomycetota bacterium]|nr:ADP-dependent NAD(P)H-hydrate dehydratase / NAD(P)H-hydrate epimerase [Actinomycetota bacterium]